MVAAPPMCRASSLGLSGMNEKAVKFKLSHGAAHDRERTVTSQLLPVICNGQDEKSELTTFRSLTDKQIVSVILQ